MANLNNVEGATVLRICLAVLLVAVPAAFADVQTITDPFPGSSCSLDTCDVIGDNFYFDIQKITFGIVPGVSMDVSIFTNYSDRTTGTSLEPWAFPGRPSLVLGIGDLFFGFPSLAYGVPLYGHGGFQAGGLYAIGGGVTTQTAQTVLGSSAAGLAYRNSEIVWLGGTAPNPLAVGSLAVTRNNASQPTYRIDLGFGSLPSEFWSAAAANGGSMSVHFASATCANDIIGGRVSVPEPGAWLLLGTLLIGLVARAVPRRC